MLDKLRDRLFASYLLVLIIALVLVALVTITTLSQRQAPREFTWNRLELLLTGFVSQSFVRDVVSSGGETGSFTDVLAAFADRNDVRVLLLVNDREDRRIAFDSDDEAATGTLAPELQISEHPPERGNNRLINNRMRFGHFFSDDAAEWLFAGLTFDLNLGRQRVDDLTLIITEPRTTDSVRAALGDFNEVFLRPLLRSALIGGVIAFLLAIVLTRNITRPLQALAKSAQQVARGEYGEQVPETGPLEVRQVAAAFNRMTGEVRATQQSQRAFMANVSHDLKTPLTSIQGYSQAIMDGAAGNPADAALIINEEAERLNRMVQELTDLARLQAGQLSMKLSPLDLNEVVTVMEKRLSMVAERENISLRVQTRSLPKINADGDRIVQVLTNLVGNAIKYTPAGGKVIIQTGVRNNGVELVVKDNGIGIPQDDLPHIFDRFYQVDKSRGPSRGTGLGLAITQEIVQGHGGEITIFSAGENQGTTVVVWFPSPHVSTVLTRSVSVE